MTPWPPGCELPSRAPLVRAPLHTRSSVLPCAAVAAGQRYLVARMEVGLDAKALQEAWNAIQKKHPALPVLFVSVGDDKAMAYAGVPQVRPAPGWRGLVCALLPGWL